MTNYKTEKEIAIMHEGGKRLGEIRSKLLEKVQPGVTALEIETYAVDLIAKHGGTPSFQTVRDYQWATCISVNDVVVHGIPNQRAFVPGDVVNVDVGLLYEGFHTDTGWTVIVGNHKKPDVVAFLDAGKRALQQAIQTAVVGHTIGHISLVIQQCIEKAGYALVSSLVGHGIGRELHEDPHVPNVLRGKIQDKPQLRVGMVFAIEPIYTMGKPDTYRRDDGWTVATVDGSLAGQFEHTIAIGQKGPIVLTQ